MEAPFSQSEGWEVRAEMLARRCLPRARSWLDRGRFLCGKKQEGVQALLPLVSLYRALIDLLGPHPHELFISKDLLWISRGAQMFSPPQPEGKRKPTTCPPWSNTPSSLSRQELQAEQQQPVHGGGGHPLHRHHKEVELGGSGPAGHRYPMAALPDRHGEGLCSSSVLLCYGGEERGEEWSGI